MFFAQLDFLGGRRPSSASGSSCALGLHKRAGRAVERGLCGPQFGEHVEPGQGAELEPAGIE